jgi:predicted HNH restriction endonuclease
MGKRLETTPRGKVRSALRLLWMRSRERARALKNAKYTCSRCGRKQSKAKGKEQKVEVHHKSGQIGNWEKVIDLIFAELLCDPEMLEVVCPECHNIEHGKDRPVNDDFKDLPFGSETE